MASIRLGSVGVALLFSVPAFTQTWEWYAGDSGGTRYSRLRQITKRNVARLRPAWIYHTGDVSDGKRWPTRSAFEATPIVVDGRMYVTTPFSRVIALDPESGAEIWASIPASTSANPQTCSSIAAWLTGIDGKDKRIFLGTLDGRLFSLDTPRPGKPDDSVWHRWVG